MAHTRLEWRPVGTCGGVAVHDFWLPTGCGASRLPYLGLGESMFIGAGQQVVDPPRDSIGNEPEPFAHRNVGPR